MKCGGETVTMRETNKGAYVDMRKFIEEKFGISNEVLLQSLTEQSKLETIRRGKMLISDGERQTVLPVLVSGIFRGFVLDEEGREVTDCFAF